MSTFGLNIKFLLYGDSLKLRLVDETIYNIPAGTLNNLQGVFKINTPLGVIYNNTNYDVPDTKPLENITEFLLDLPITEDNNIYNGKYNVEYNKKFTITNSIIVDPTDKTKVNIGNSDYIKTLIKDKFYTINNIGEIKSYDVVSIKKIFNNYIVIVSEEITDEDIIGLYYDYKKIIVKLTTNFIKPKAKLSVYYNCITSQLFSEDITEYGNNLYQLTINHIAKYPITIDPTIPDYIAHSKKIIVSPIYTTEWLIYLDNVAVYKFDNYYIETDIKTTEGVNVKCNNCYCGILKCIHNLYLRWEYALTINPEEASRLELILRKISYCYMLYEMSINCMDYAKADFYCKKLFDLAGEANCKCCDDSEDAVAKLVKPLVEGITLKDCCGTEWFNNDGQPDENLGENGDYYLDNITKNYYKKINNKWVLQGSLSMNIITTSSTQKQFDTVADNKPLTNTSVVIAKIDYKQQEIIKLLR